MLSVLIHDFGVKRTLRHRLHFSRLLIAVWLRVSLVIDYWLLLLVRPLH